MASTFFQTVVDIPTGLKFEDIAVMRMDVRDWFLLLILSFLWGGSFFFTEIALLEASPLLTVWGRVTGAAIILTLFLRFQGMSLPSDMKTWAAFFVMGLLNNAIPFSLIVWGQTEITGSLASIFNATTPLFTVILAQFLTKDEKITPLKIWGILIGFLGVITVIGIEAVRGMSIHIWAQGIILIAAVSYGLAAIWGRRFTTLQPMVVASGQVICSTVLLAPITIVWGFPQGLFLPSLSTIGAILGLAFLCTALAYTLYFKILATSGATNLMLVTLLIPFSAICLGSLLLGESLTLEQMAGMLLILTGLLIMDGRVIHQLRKTL